MMTSCEQCGKELPIYCESCYRIANKADAEISRLRERVEELEQKVVDTGAMAAGTIGAVKSERDKLREALTDLIQSADASWGEYSSRYGGHDWREALAAARAALDASAGEGDGE